MGQKANTLTLRKNNESLNFVSLNAKEFTNALEFIKVFKRSLDKKGVVITKSDFNCVANTSYLVMNLFYKTQKLAKYKKKALKNKLSLFRLQNKRDSFLNRTKKAKISSKRLRPWFNIKKLKNNNVYLDYMRLKKNVLVQKRLAFLFKNLIQNGKIVLKTFVINKELKQDSVKLKELYFKFNEYKNKLFSRRFNLFVDFIKLTCLIQQRKITAATLLSTLGTIFKILPKRLHNSYFRFLKSLIQEVLLEQKKVDKTTKIIGVKLLINGKLRGKLRSSSLTINQGRIGAQVLSNNMEFAKVHVNTMYGCFGFQLWVTYENIKKEKIKKNICYLPLKKQSLKKDKKVKG